MAAERATLAIFPLSNVVLFPEVQTPLHLFEERYRQMAEHVLAGERRIGMVVVPPEHVDEMAGDPPIYPIGCAGVITGHQLLPDGRHNIVLQGTQRFRVAREVERGSGRLYRVAEVELLEDAFDESELPRVAALRERILELVRSLIERERPEGAFADDVLRALDDVAFVNALANAFAFPAVEKQGLLEADRIALRYERLEGLLTFHLAGQTFPGSPSSGSIH